MIPAWGGPKGDFDLILLFLNMIIHKNFTGPTQFLPVNVQGPVSFAVSADKQVIDTHTHTHTDRQTHMYTDATDDNTLRLKLASGKKLITDRAQTAEKWSKQVRSIPPVHTAGTLYRRYEVYK